MIYYIQVLSGLWNKFSMKYFMKSTLWRAFLVCGHFKNIEFEHFRQTLLVEFRILKYITDNKQLYYNCFLSKYNSDKTIFNSFPSLLFSVLFSQSKINLTLDSDSRYPLSTNDSRTN